VTDVKMQMLRSVSPVLSKWPARTVRAVMVALIVLLGFAIPAGAQQGGDADLAKGVKQVQDGYLDDAVGTLNGVVRRLSGSPARQPDLAQAYLWLGIAHAQLDAEKSARASFRQALELDPRVSLGEGWPPKVTRAFAAVQAEVGRAAPAPTARATTGEAAVQEFAAKVEATVQAGDASFLDAAVDLDAVLDKAMKGVDAPPDLVRQYRDQAKRQFRWGTLIVEEVKKGGSYHFLRTRPGAGNLPHALFRIIPTTGGVNYHEYALQRDVSGRVTATDLNPLTQGWLSDTARREWLAIAAASGLAQTLKGLAGFENDYVKSLPEILAIQKLEGEGQNQAALARLLKLPPSVQANKTLLATRAVLAGPIGGQDYEDAVAAFRRRFPGDPALNLLLIDYYGNKEQYDAAMASVDRLRQALGGADAIQDLMRSNILRQKGDLRAAKVALQEAIEREPTLLKPYFALLDLSVIEKDYTETVRLATLLEKGSVSIPDLSTLPLYADFVRSNEYKRWLESRQQ
jgi:tetratricopeptide (TPR) repeat protein